MNTGPRPLDSSSEQVAVDVVMTSLDPVESIESGAARRQATTQLAVRGFNIPDYSSVKGFLYLAWDKKYGNFVKEVQAINSCFIDKKTMERLWKSEVQKHYNKDGSGINSVLDLALADALQQVNGYRGFDANLYWNLQSVTSEIERMSMVKIEETMETQELKNNGPDDKLQNELVESRSVAEKQWRDMQGTLSTSVSSNAYPQHVSYPATHDLSTSTTTSATPFYTWTPYVHPGILRRKIDESYDFDEDDDTLMGE